MPCKLTDEDKQADLAEVSIMRLQEVVGTHHRCRGVWAIDRTSPNADGDLTRHHVLPHFDQEIKSRGFKRDRRWFRGLIKISDQRYAHRHDASTVRDLWLDIRNTQSFCRFNPRFGSCSVSCIGILQTCLPILPCIYPSILRVCTTFVRTRCLLLVCCTSTARKMFETRLCQFAFMSAST